MKASLICPTYNQCSRLNILLRSLREDVFNKDEFEVVVVDDGSTDDTEQTVNNLDVDYQLRYIKLDKNSGRSQARNAGVEHASGEIIIFCDSDRVPCKNFISGHYHAHEGRKKRVVIGNNLELFTDNLEEKTEELVQSFRADDCKILRKCRYFNFAESVTPIYDEEGHTESGLAWLTLFSGNFSMRKEDFLDVGGFDTSFVGWGCENMELGYRLVLQGYDYCYKEEIYNCHLYHVSQRKADDNGSAFSHFCQMYKTQEIEKLPMFLKGELSLQEYETISEHGKQSVKSLEPIYFIETKFGGRFKRK